MKEIYLPYAIEKIVRALSYIAVFILDIVNFVLTPITWIKTKAHIFMGSVCCAYYLVFGLILKQTNAHWLAIATFVLAVLCVALIKLARKKLIEIRHSLMNIFYSPVGVCLRVKPIFHRFEKKNCNKFANCGSLD